MANRVNRELAREMRSNGDKYLTIAAALGCSVDWCKRNLNDVVTWKKDFVKYTGTGRVKAKRTQKRPKAPEGNYVYCAVHAQQVAYIGKGSKYRYEHVNSGKSCSVLLNKAYFEGIDFDVFILYEGLDRETALQIESREIARISPYLNCKGLVYQNVSRN